MSRGSAINESLVYLSYHNSDIAIACQLATALQRYYRTIWLDRFEIAPAEAWGAGIKAARERATHVVAIVSEAYLRSAYCRAEYAIARGRELPVTALQTGALASKLPADFSSATLIDFRPWLSDANAPCLEALLNQIPESPAATSQGERQAYLRGFIQALEIELALMPTSWLSLGSSAADDCLQLRPRQYTFSQLDSLEFTAKKLGLSQRAKNLRRWAESEPQFLLSGGRGSGKTSFARLLALAQAHRALRDESAALPIWLDLAAVDAGQQTLEDCLEAQWPLLSYWAHWIERNTAYFILDNWDAAREHSPSLPREISAWIENSPKQRFAVLSARDDAPELSLPQAQLTQMTAAQASDFAAAHLPERLRSGFQQLLSQETTLIENDSLDFLALCLEGLGASPQFDFGQWQRDPIPPLVTNRLRLKPGAARALAAPQLIEALRQLAWALTVQEQPRLLPRAEAERPLHDPRLLECALELGILREVGATLRFENAAMQRFFALNGLRREDLRTHLKAPVFSAGRGKIARKWDALALTLVQCQPREERQDLIAQIAEIDPLLGAECARRHPHTYPGLSDGLISALTLLGADMPAARDAIRESIRALPALEKTAASLVGKLAALNNAAQLWLWQEIASLPLEIPPRFFELVAEICRDADAPAGKLLAESSLHLAIARLAIVSRREELPLRRNAIRLLGEFGFAPSALLLLQHLHTADSAETHELILALMRFSHCEIMRRIFRWSRENPAQMPVLLAALAARKRRVTSHLLRLSAANRLSISEDFYELAADIDETDIAIGWAVLAAEHQDLPKAIANAIKSKPNAADLGRRLEATISNMPDAAASAQLLQSAERVLQEPPDASIRAGSKLEALLYGQTIFDPPPQAEAEAPLTSVEPPAPPDERDEQESAPPLEEKYLPLLEQLPPDDEAPTWESDTLPESGWTLPEAEAEGEKRTEA